MLLSKDVEVKIVGRNMDYYENLGYEIPRYFNRKENKYTVKRGTTIMAQVSDLPKQSHVNVLVMCDYCKKEFHTRYDALINQRKSEIEKDCCFDCRAVKNEELNLIRYGVKNQFQREEIKVKVKKTMIETYGVSHPMKSNEIKQKAINTMSNNGSIQTSRQQTYIHSIVGGILNYNDNTTGFYSLDIAFPDDKVFIEYDGSGHSLQVVFGNKTECEFKREEVIRSSFLRRNGWREITIISNNDKIPSNNQIIKIKNEALLYLNNGHSWITYDIDKNKVICSEYQTEYDFGKLRRITEKDLKIA